MYCCRPAGGKPPPSQRVGEVPAGRRRGFCSEEGRRRKESFCKNIAEKQQDRSSPSDGRCSIIHKCLYRTGEFRTSLLQDLLV